MQEEHLQPGDSQPGGDDPASGCVRIVYYTDPLCCWSWALEPHWQRLRYEFGDHLQYCYRMGGLIPDWDKFRDPLNSIHRPGQMGPYWMYVRSVSGVPIDEGIWHEDPPASSYPACIAVKAAERQGPEQAERYLRRLRQAVMTERRNVAHRDVLLDLAGELAAEVREGASFDLPRFADDLDAADTLAAFRDDLKEARYQGIGRFPTLALLRPDGTGLLLVGYRPYSVLRDALQHLMPTLEPERTLSDAALPSGLTEER